MKSVGPFLVVLFAVGQTACLRNLHRVARVPPHQAPAESEDREAQSQRRSNEWFNQRHRDGGLRQKAVEEKQLQAPDVSGVSGPWRPTGPQPIRPGFTTFSGRVFGIAVDPRNSSVVYVGTDGGGVWKTTNGGANWTPLTDQQANLNIRDLAMAPSAPDTIFAATWGGGILRSTDAGATWTTSLPGEYVLSLAVHPTNPSIVLAAGSKLFRSTDGGTTWNTPGGVSSGQVAFDPTNGNIGYFTGPQAGLYRSTDSGLTWNPVAGRGLPAGANRYDFALAPSSTNVLYLAVKSFDPHLIGFYRSADSGASWTQVGTPPYDDIDYWGWSLRVHPTNPNLIYAGSLWLHTSTDGGKTWAQNDDKVHVDHHVQVYSADGNILYIGNDGGIWRTFSPTSTKTSWTSLNDTLNTAMFYPGISIHPSTASISLGGTQDNGVLQRQGYQNWMPVACGDGGSTAIDFEQPQNEYAACSSLQSGVLINASTDAGATFHAAMSGINSQEPMEFLPPLVMDPSNPKRLYFGTNRLYQSVDGAGSWKAILDDGGDIVATIAVAPSDPNTIYVGRVSGSVLISRNALSGTRATWTAGSLPLSNPRQITVDPQNPLTAWAAAYPSGDPSRGPVYRTIDGGVTWASMSNGLPHLMASDILVDPDISNTIYAATDIGVYRSSDGGQNWLPLGTGLPNVICHSLRLFRPTHTLRVATYGRGMWDLSSSPPSPGALSVTHINNFQQGQPQAMYTISVQNNGSTPGSGTVIVSDTLPASFTAAAIAGSGWTCSLSTLSCSRSDSLAAGAAYPPITVTVSVPTGGPTQTSYYLTNQVTLSGGLGTAVATDITTVQIPLDDVAPTDPFMPAIGLMWESGITSGCYGPYIRYCPNDVITLGQMAVFVVRSVMGGDDFPYTPTPYFNDVPATHPFFKWIQKMQDLGIALPCGGNQYCPDTPVTRGVMAVLIIRGRYRVSGASNYLTIPYFTDVPPTHPYFGWIQKMKQLGITSGCAPQGYCPDNPVTRGQMAVFIERGLFNQLLPASTQTVAWVSPNTASPGTNVTVTLAGQNSSFFSGGTGVNAGPGIVVSNINVVNGATVTAQFAVAADAALGPRSITITMGGVEATLPNGFHVQ